MNIATREVRVWGRKQVMVIDCEGALTKGDACSLLQSHVKALFQGGTSRILFNFEGVTRLDYDGLDVLIKAYTSARDRDIKLRIACVRPHIEQWLASRRLDTILMITGILREATERIALKRATRPAA